MKNNDLIWFENNIIKRDDAKINVLSPTAQFGLNVFEGIRCYWNDNSKKLYAFRLDDHIKRLIISSNLLGLANNFSHEIIIEYLKKTLVKNNYSEDISVRQTL